MNNSKFTGRKSWMAQQREKFGESFIGTVRLDVLYNNLERILEDIAEGRVEKDKDFTVNGFYNSTFVNAMHKFCNARYIYFGQMYTAFNAMVQTNPSLQQEATYMLRVQMYANQYTFYYNMSNRWAQVEQNILNSNLDPTIMHAIQTEAATFAQQNPISMNRLFSPRENM